MGHFYMRKQKVDPNGHYLFKIIYHCCPVKIVKYHLRLNSLNSVLDIQALI